MNAEGRGSEKEGYRTLKEEKERERKGRRERKGEGRERERKRRSERKGGMQDAHIFKYTSKKHLERASVSLISACWPKTRPLFVQSTSKFLHVCLPPSPLSLSLDYT